MLATCRDRHLRGACRTLGERHDLLANLIIAAAAPNSVNVCCTSAGSTLRGSAGSAAVYPIRRLCQTFRRSANGMTGNILLLKTGLSHPGSLWWPTSCSSISRKGSVRIIAHDSFNLFECIPQRVHFDGTECKTDSVWNMPGCRKWLSGRHRDLLLHQLQGYPVCPRLFP